MTAVYTLGNGETTSLLSVKARKLSLTKATRSTLMTYSRSFSFVELLKKGDSATAATADSGVAAAAALELKEMKPVQEQLSGSSSSSSSSSSACTDDEVSSCSDSICSCSQADSLKLSGLREDEEEGEEHVWEMVHSTATEPEASARGFRGGGDSANSIACPV